MNDSFHTKQTKVDLALTGYGRRGYGCLASAPHKSVAVRTCLTSNPSLVLIPQWLNGYLMYVNRCGVLYAPYSANTGETLVWFPCLLPFQRHGSVEAAVQAFFEQDHTPAKVDNVVDGEWEDLG